TRDSCALPAVGRHAPGREGACPSDDACPRGSAQERMRPRRGSRGLDGGPSVRPSIFLLLAIALTLAIPAHATTPFWCGSADLTGDGVVGTPDYLKFTGCFGQSPGPAPTGFLGFSTATLSGAHGQLVMNGACVDTFGAGAFMCPTTAFAMQPV